MHSKTAEGPSPIAGDEASDTATAHADTSPSASPAASAGSPADLQACVALMQGGSRTFFAASRLLPPRVRAAAIALYAFCRVADDLVDEAPVGDERPLQTLRERLDRLYAGIPMDHVEDHALSMVVQQYGLPRHLLDALVEGFAWDAGGRTYDTLEEVQAYGARVAGSVGAMMCWIMGPRDASTLARACELGVAMQLTNIARDVGADAALGRLYLPRQWLREAGLQPEAWLAQPQFNPALGAVVERLLQAADQLYRRGERGIAALPPDCRAAILAASLIYGEIGLQLRREGLDSVSQRTVVSTGRKLVLLAAAWTQSHFVYMPATREAPLAAIAGLVEGCCSAPATTPPATGWFPNRAMPQRVAWMLELFERREHERLARRSPQGQGRQQTTP